MHYKKSHSDDVIQWHPIPSLGVCRVSVHYKKSHSDDVIQWHPIPSLGVCRVSVHYKKCQISTYLEVVREECRPALRCGPDCDKLGLVKRGNAMKKDEAKSNDTMRVEIKKSHESTQ